MMTKRHTAKLTDDVIALLTWDDDEETRQSPEGHMTPMAARAVLLAALERRNNRLDDLYRALGDADLDRKARDIIDEFVSKSYAAVQEYSAKPQAMLDMESDHEPQWGQISEGWFYFCDQFDRTLRVLMDEAIQKLRPSK